MALLSTGGLTGFGSPRAEDRQAEQEQDQELHHVVEHDVTITSWAPVRAFMKPTNPPVMDPPMKPPITATTTWRIIGMWTAKPIQPAIMGSADELSGGADVEQTRPEGKRYRQARQDEGVAFTAVSDSGLKIAAIEPPWKAQK